MRLLGRVALAFVLSALPARALADEETAVEPTTPRHSLHWGLGAGGFTAVTGPAEYGLSLGGELYPGGRFGRYGVRAEVRGYDDGDDGHASIGITFIAAATRPRLQLALHADLGVTRVEQLPTAGCGIQTQLWLAWPFALAIDGGAVLFVDGTDTVLALSSSLQLRVAY